MDVFWFLLSIKFHFQQLVKIQNKDTLAAELTLRKKITCCDTPDCDISDRTWTHHKVVLFLHCGLPEGWQSEPERLTVRTREADSQNPADGLYSWTLQTESQVSAGQWSSRSELRVSPWTSLRVSAACDSSVGFWWQFDPLTRNHESQLWVLMMMMMMKETAEWDLWLLVIIGDYWWLLRRLISRLKS